MKKIGVLGAGTWGMALARMLCNAGNEVIVWSALGAEIDELEKTHRHPKQPEMQIEAPAPNPYRPVAEETDYSRDTQTWD